MLFPPTHSCRPILASKSMSHDQLLKLLEQLSLERLGHIIAPHLRGGTVLNLQITFLDLIGQKEIPDIERTGTLARAALPIVLQ